MLGSARMIPARALILAVKIGRVSCREENLDRLGEIGPADARYYQVSFEVLVVVVVDLDEVH